MKRLAAAALVVACSAACLFPDLSTLESNFDAGVEAAAEATADANDAGASCDPTKPFTSIRPIAELNDGDDQYHPTLTSDELEIWYGSSHKDDAGDTRHIAHATRAVRTDAFGPYTIESAAEPGDPVDPALSQDGLTLIFVRSGTIGDFDLFRATRATRADAFINGIQVPSNVLSTVGDISPFVTADGSLYFESSRGGNFDTYYAAAAQNGTFAAPVLVPSLSSTAYEDGLALTFDGLTVYLASERTDLGTAGGTDVFVGHRASIADDFALLANVAELNTSGNERVKWVSPDACRVYYESTKSSQTDFDLFVAEKFP